MPSVWRDSLVALGVGLIAILALFHDTAATAVHLWASSSAYNYGYLVAPIAAYVTWHDRGRLAGLIPAPSAWGLLVAALAAILWLASDLLGIDEGRHFALVGVMQALLIGIFGPEIYRRMLFPCLYLFLMVPSGDELLGSLQKISHAGSVVLLQASHIPTYTEGMFIEVPHGNFLVEPGCAGLNFFLASLALALLFGKLTYRRPTTRILCVAIALLTSVIANVVRIYLIVAITEWSRRQIDIADDHLLYGWGFFALVMLGMMWVGARFGVPPRGETVPAVPQAEPASLGWTAAATAAVLAIAAVPVAAAALTVGPREMEVAHVALPPVFGPWPSLLPKGTGWRPGFVPGDGDAWASYDVSGHRVDAVAIVYRAQHSGREAAAAGNSPADGKSWEEMERSLRPTVIGGRPVDALEATIRAGNDRRLVLAWYVSADCVTASRLMAKICAARQRLGGHPAPGAYVALSTEMTESPATARAVLNQVAAKLSPSALMIADTPHAPPLASGAG